MKNKSLEFVKKINLQTINALLSLLALILFLTVNFTIEYPGYSGFELIDSAIKNESVSFSPYIFYIIIPLIVFLLFACFCKDPSKKARRIISSCLMLIPVVVTIFYIEDIKLYVGFYVYILISVAMIFMNFVQKSKNILITSIALIVVVFGVVGIKSELRGNILIRLNYNPCNTYRELRVGRILLNKHMVSNYDYVDFSRGMIKWQDNSGYNIFLAGINAPSGCDGCNECYKLYQTAGLINYEVINEDENYIVAEVQLTKKGEKYALDKRISKNNPDYDEIMRNKDSGVRYVLFSYRKFNGYEKDSDYGLSIIWYSSNEIVCHNESYRLTLFTPFATALGLEREGSKYVYPYSRLYKTKDNGWKEER